MEKDVLEFAKRFVSLDDQARIYFLRRAPGESDESLQARIAMVEATKPDAQ